MRVSLFDPFIKKSGTVLLDGAMATELEKHGADLNHALWSARLLVENPSLIRKVHLDYLRAGADIITTASYQASFNGFEKQGYSKTKAIELMRLSTKLAWEAREEAIAAQVVRLPHPLIAASVGPYGASLADGSEYRGHYGRSIEELMDFHRERLSVLSDSGADLLACETIPCADEAIALIRLLKEFPTAKAWISFSCRHGEEVSDGGSFALCAALANDSDQVVAVGINCTAPEYVESLVKTAISVSNKPVVVYPNKGDTYDAVHKCWIPATRESNFAELAIRWKKAGATLIGGCCRSSPEDIKNLQRAFTELKEKS